MIIADTGFRVALANDRDKYHQLAIDVLSRLDEPLITIWPVLTETCHLLLNRRGFGGYYRESGHYFFNLGRWCCMVTL